MEDDEELRGNLAARFQRLGMAVDGAATVAEASALAEAKTYDVALLDYHLPDGTGIEVLERIKKQPELEAIMLTGHGSIETAIQAMRLGAYDYLTKPFHFPELDVHIQKAHEKAAWPAASASGSIRSASNRRATGWSAPAKSCTR